MQTTTRRENWQAIRPILAPLSLARGHACCPKDYFQAKATQQVQHGKTRDRGSATRRCRLPSHGAKVKLATRPSPITRASAAALTVGLSMGTFNPLPQVHMHEADWLPWKLGTQIMLGDGDPASIWPYPWHELPKAASMAAHLISARFMAPAP
jgi:hypothetical protein